MSKTEKHRLCKNAPKNFTLPKHKIALITPNLHNLEVREGKIYIDGELLGNVLSHDDVNNHITFKRISENRFLNGTIQSLVYGISSKTLKNEQADR